MSGGAATIIQAWASVGSLVIGLPQCGLIVWGLRQ